jgi:predicted DNA binding CopG/RHH family protein
MKESPMRGKVVPRLKTDKQAEAFLAQDLSNLDFSQFKPARFEFEKKDASRSICGSRGLC